jgi:prepilin-type N-terminal cleavage/methylation domain-containing protein
MINKTGFTLIETLVAVLLLSIAIVGPLTIASKGLNSALISKDQIGAYYLAQDAVEYLRFARDSNRLGGGNWLTGAGAVAGIDLTACESANGCYLDSVQSTVAVCSTSCPVLNWDSTNHYYSYTTGTQSLEHYIRTVKLLTPVGTNNSEAGVTVTVQWLGAGGIPHSVILREDMFDWE